MKINIPREKSERIINIFQYFTNLFPESIDELILVNKKGVEGITIEITPIKFQRSRAQENYYRKHCAGFAHFCGMTPDEMHEEILCQTYGSTEHATPFGIKRRPAKRSGDATRGQYSDLIETLCRVAAEMGHYIPPPERPHE